MPTPAHTSQCWSRQAQHGLRVCIWMQLVNGTGNNPSMGQPTPGVVKQDKSSRGSIDKTKTSPDPQRVRVYTGERPIGAARGKQTNTLPAKAIKPANIMKLRPGQTGICGLTEASGQNHQHQVHRSQQGAPLSQERPPQGAGEDRVRRPPFPSPSPSPSPSVPTATRSPAALYPRRW